MNEKGNMPCVLTSTDFTKKESPMSLVEENKLQKKDRLMEAAFRLYTQQGITKTSITDIVQKAGIAKGTFYLYFEDKYDLEKKLIAHKSEQIFRHAVENSGYEEKEGVILRTLAIVDDVIDQLEKNPLLLRFIYKNLSWGIFLRTIDKSDMDYTAVFRNIIGADVKDTKQAETCLFTFVELLGATSCNVILRGEPMTMEEYRPYLHRSIEAIIHSFFPDVS